MTIPTPPFPRQCQVFAFCAMVTAIIVFAAAYPTAAVEIARPEVYHKTYFGPRWFPWLLYGVALFSILPICMIEIASAAQGKAAQWLVWFTASGTPHQVLQLGQFMLFINLLAMLLLNILSMIAYAPGGNGVYGLIGVIAYGWAFMIVAAAYLGVIFWVDYVGAQAAYAVVQQGPSGGSAPAI